MRTEAQRGERACWRTHSLGGNTVFSDMSSPETGAWFKDARGGPSVTPSPTPPYIDEAGGLTQKRAPRAPGLPRRILPQLQRLLVTWPAVPRVRQHSALRSWDKTPRLDSAKSISISNPPPPHPCGCIPPWKPLSFCSGRIQSNHQVTQNLPGPSGTARGRGRALDPPKTG